MTERLWFKIGEAAQRVGVAAKELRYWERVIPEIKPRRSRGNLRYYHVDELPRLLRIKEWLDEGLTVADCKALLNTGHLARGLDLGMDEEGTDTPVSKPSKGTKTSVLPQGRLKAIHEALKALHARLSKAPRLR